jgi:hypothetical protein
MVGAYKAAVPGSYVTHGPMHGLDDLLSCNVTLTRLLYVHIRMGLPIQPMALLAPCE